MAQSKTKKSNQKIRNNYYKPRYETANTKTPLQKIILIIIISAMVLVIVALVLVLFLNPENQIKSKISSRSANYYETYIYKDFENISDKAKLEKAMEKYQKNGFTKTPLRQILFYDHSTLTDEDSFIISHCDENETFIQFFPDPPYTKTSYHIEYTFACDF